MRPEGSFLLFVWFSTMPWIGNLARLTMSIEKSCFFYTWEIFLIVWGCWRTDKESTCNAWDLGSLPGLGRSSGEGKCHSLQYSSLENSIDCIVHGVAKSWTQVSNFHFHFQGLWLQVISFIVNFDWMGNLLVVQWLGLKCCHCCGPKGSIPGQGQGTKIPWAVWHGKKKRKLMI